jgi:hypothetical protein
MNFVIKILIYSFLNVTLIHSSFYIINISFEIHDIFLALINVLLHNLNMLLLVNHINENDLMEMILYLVLLPFYFIINLYKYIYVKIDMNIYIN